MKRSPSEMADPWPAPTEAAPQGWLFLLPEAVPGRWRDRAIDVRLVPLLPDETSRLLAGDAAESELDRDEERLARLVAAGLSPSAMARELGLNIRSVERRLVKLRRRFDVDSTAALAAFLSRRGF